MIRDVQSSPLVWEPSSGVIILCVKVSPELIALATPLCPYHEVYICPDRPDSKHPPRPAKPYEPGVIVVDARECVASGWYGSVSFMPRAASSRCKALRWLSLRLGEAGRLNHWWMLEEDVFIPTEFTLLRMDRIYGRPASELTRAKRAAKWAEGTPSAAKVSGSEVDLICPHHFVRTGSSGPFDLGHWSGERRWNHWRWARNMGVPLPWASSLVCGIRVSMRLVEEIARFVDQYHRLLFCELIFNTVAEQRGLRVVVAREMMTIVWKVRSWEGVSILPTCLYHPMKRLRQHINLRGNV